MYITLQLVTVTVSWCLAILSNMFRCPGNDSAGNGSRLEFTCSYDIRIVYPYTSPICWIRTSIGTSWGRMKQQVQLIC